VHPEHREEDVVCFNFTSKINVDLISVDLSSFSDRLIPPVLL
jgi:hypothetical protein